MDELTLLRNTRDDTLQPSPDALAASRAALMERIATSGTAPAPAPAAHRRRRLAPRLTWVAAGLAAALTGVLVVGNVTLSTQSAYASNILRTAAAETSQYVDLVPGSGQFLRSVTHAQWAVCYPDGCKPRANEQVLDVYMPADPNTDWTLRRDWGNQDSGLTGEFETLRAVDGDFDRSGVSWASVDYADIPLNGAAAYAWIDSQYTGGSASRDEDNFDRITEILRTGLVPAAQRAALLDALSRVPGVTGTSDVANLDGKVGVAIGRDEPLRSGERREIIVDPDTGLIIGERSFAGTTVFGWGPREEMTLTAIESTIVDGTP